MVEGSLAFTPKRGTQKAPLWKTSGCAAIAPAVIPCVRLKAELSCYRESAKAPERYRQARENLAYELQHHAGEILSEESS
jgi:hypothetical protein